MSQHRVVNGVADYSASMELSMELPTTGCLQFFGQISEWPFVLWFTPRERVSWLYSIVSSEWLLAVLHSSPGWTFVQCFLFLHFFRRAWLYGIVFTPGFAYALTMIFNISGHGLQCFRVVLSSMTWFISKMDFCATCHVWLYLQASMSVLFHVFFQVRMRRCHGRCFTIRLQGSLIRKNSITVQKCFQFLLPLTKSSLSIGRYIKLSSSP